MSEMVSVADLQAWIESRPKIRLDGHNRTFFEDVIKRDKWAEEGEVLIGQFQKQLQGKLRTFTAYQGTLNQCDKDFIKFIKEVLGGQKHET